MCVCRRCFRVGQLYVSDACCCLQPSGISSDCDSKCQRGCCALGHPTANSVSRRHFVSLTSPSPIVLLCRDRRTAVLQSSSRAFLVAAAGVWNALLLYVIVLWHQLKASSVVSTLVLIIILI